VFSFDTSIKDSYDTIFIFIDKWSNAPFLFVFIFIALKVLIVKPFIRNEMENSSVLPSQSLGVAIPRSLIFGNG